MHRHAKLSLMTLHIFFIPNQMEANPFICLLFVIYVRARCSIITRGLYILNPHLEGKDIYLRGFFHKILALTTVSVQERLIIKSGL